jgi:hypothetical protein
LRARLALLWGPDLNLAALSAGEHLKSKELLADISPLAEKQAPPTRGPANSELLHSDRLELRTASQARVGINSHLDLHS